MQTDRYDYSPIVTRKPFEWPNKARVALMVAPNIEFFHIDKVIPGATNSLLPDVTGYALRDYGSRIGVFRMMEVLDKHGIRATVLLNADVCAHHPAIIEEGNKRSWEWLGHGVTNNIRMTQYPPEEERSVIRQIRDTIAGATGKGPRGWLGPGGADESPNTLDHLAAEGFDYVCDWGLDDQPCPMRVKSGRMIAIPYQQGLNDIRVIFQGGHTPKDWLQMVCDQFDQLYAEGSTQGRVMTIPLHPFVIGLAFRIKYLEQSARIHLCARRSLEDHRRGNRRLLLRQLLSETVSWRAVMKIGRYWRRETILSTLLIAGLVVSMGHAADRVVIGNVSRTVEQLPNYAATDKGFFAQEGIQGDVVLIGSTDTLIQALIAGQINVAIVDPSAAINAVEARRIA